jgi:CRP-like cAMP-binding protein
VEGLAELEVVRAAARPVDVGAGTVVFEVGDPVDAIHVVTRGVAFVRSVSIDGDLAVVDVRGRGELLDDTAILGDGSALHYDGVTAMTAVSLLRLPLSVFDELRDTSAGVGAALVAQATSQVRRLSSALVDLLGRPAKARAARRLVCIAAALDASGMGGEPLTITQQDLADYAGTTRSTLNAHLQVFESIGAVRLARGSITIIDVDGLRRFT